MDLGLAGKVALVTGASSGLGLAIAHELAAEGASVAIVSRRRDAIDRAAKEIMGRARSRVLPLAGDVTKGEDVARVVDEASRDLGPIDILVANAGGPPSTTFATTSEEQYRAALDLNLMSGVNLARACVPGMRQRKWGRVLFVASFVAKEPMVGLILSNTARAGLLAFAKTMAREVAADNVLVNCILPGHFDTARARELAEMRAKREGKSVDELLNSRAHSIPVGRTGKAEEFAAVVAFLASTRASFVTGTAIQVDGGQVMGLL